MLQLTWKLVYMYLGVVEKKLPLDFWIFWFFPILEGLKVEKMTILSDFGQKFWAFWKLEIRGFLMVYNMYKISKMT